MRVWVLGLSDIGRSPRLQNHALSLASQAGCIVDVIGQRGSQPLEALTSHESITIHHIPPLPSFVDSLPGPLRLIFKAILQAWTLFTLLMFQIPAPKVILLQVPPAIPTLFLGWLVAKCRGAKLLIDWHNFGFSLMALGMRKSNPLVVLAEWHEKFWGRQADAHLCVSKAMSQHLKKFWAIDAIVFYDKAPSSFQPASMEQKHQLFTKLRNDIEAPLHLNDALHEFCEAEDRKVTVCTEIRNGKVEARQKRPVIVATSTSWTPDEDFSLLLHAATIYDQKAREAPKKLPTLLIVVTGKGPQKAEYMSRMSRLDLRHVAFRCLWLSSEDYPVLLGSADIGVSLHYSSSGMDLPMKVVDMFGCGLPVLSCSYPCISELVVENENGHSFSGAKQLACLLEELLSEFAVRGHSSKLDQLRWNVLKARIDRSNSWEACWEETVKPLIEICNL